MMPQLASFFRGYWSRSGSTLQQALSDLRLCDLRWLFSLVWACFVCHEHKFHDGIHKFPVASHVQTQSSKTMPAHLNSQILTNFAQELSTYQLNCITSANACWTRKCWPRKHALPTIKVLMCLPKPYLMMPFDVHQVRSADGETLRGSVMNTKFMMEFTNSCSKLCKFLPRLSHFRRDWRQNLQPKLKTHNSSLTNLWNATSLT